MRNRIRLSAMAYAYEVEDDPIADDPTFDALALAINPEAPTGNRKLDNFFRKHFAPDTGMWVLHHPEKRKLKALVGRIRKLKTP